MRKISKSLVAISMLSAVSVCCASEGFYVGANIGQASYDATLSDFNVLDDGSIFSASLDDSDTSFSLRLGYQLTPNIAFEGGFIDLGELTVNANSDWSGFLYEPGPVTFTITAEGLFFDVKGLLPLNEQFSLYGKLGLLKWDGTGTLSDSTRGISVDDDGNDTFYGIGASFNATSKIALNLDYSFYNLDGDDVDVLSVGIQFGF